MSEPEYPSGRAERELLDAWLDHERDAVLRKLAGLSEEDARRPMVPSGVSLLSLVKHLGYTERWWFRVCFAGDGEPAFPDTDYADGTDPTFRLTGDDTVASVTQWYHSTIARSREIAASAALEDVAARPGNDYTLRWIMIHMIEETARHAGHADIIREQLDGETGM